MKPVHGYHLIGPDDLQWRPSNLMKIPNADFLERTGSENLSARLWRMPPGSENTPHMQFAEVFPDEQIVAALRRQLGWTHFRMLIPLDDELKRDFYAEMCRIERWSTRTLEKKIGGMLYERTALSRKPDKLIRRELAALREEDKLTPDLVFRDPYVLDFLGLRDTYAEKDVEAAISREIESFIQTKLFHHNCVRVCRIPRTA